MKNASIRILVLLAVVTLIGTVGTQLYWIKLAIDQQDQVFSHNMHVALRNVVESLCEASGKDYPSTDPIEQISSNYFVVRTNDQINLSDLEYLIAAEIRERAITQDFEYGVYNCQNDRMVFARNVSSDRASSRPLPTLENQDYYFGVYFPNKSQGLIAGLDIWKFTASLTMIILIFFGYALFVILRQKRLSEMQKDFVNNVTHELKTPLTTLSLAAESIAGKSGEKQSEYLRIIRSEVEKLQHSVQDILQASVMESHVKPLCEPVNVGQLLEDLMSDLRIQYASKMISWELSGRAPNPVKGNKKILDTCIRNLVDNAVKYGGREISIELGQKEQQTRVTVSDDGGGIPTKYLPFLFKKFFRVPEMENRQNTSGFGLGLYLVKKSLRGIGGSIKVSSSEGKGSSFTIILSNG